jgi:threonylcarbamoyladenosine tRNA methylthiotransferase MtaB
LVSGILDCRLNTAVAHQPHTFAPPDTFAVKNFGCRAAQADGAAIELSLAARGAIAAPVDEASLVILNTCTVTSAADDEVRHLIRRTHRDNPQARILITGCYAQRAPDELASLPGVEWVVGNSHKTQIADIVAAPPHYHSQLAPGDLQPAGVHHGDINARLEFLSAPIEDACGDRTRPNLKIQDGCNNLCSFCIIPTVRGRSRSASADEAVAQLRPLAERFREVVLSGINLGRWGREAAHPQGRLADLLRRLLNETPIERLRLSSVEPMDFSDDLLSLMAGSLRMARHVHAPLQSASDTVLRRMKRRYRQRHYQLRIETARALMPDAAIGADVMTGFPGETDAEFHQTRTFIEAMPFTYLHVFTYSERPGTPASEMPQVPVNVRRERNHVLRELAAQKNSEFRQRFIGRTLSAVTLQSGLAALSTNYLKIDLAHARPANQLIDVRIGALTEAGLSEHNPLRLL